MIEPSEAIAATACICRRSIICCLVPLDTETPFGRLGEYQVYNWSRILDLPIARGVRDRGKMHNTDPSQSPIDAVRSSPAQHTAPFADAVQAYAARAPLSLGVPGHGADPLTGGEHIAAVLGNRVVEYDVPMMMTRLNGGAPLQEAQELAAEAWGARRTWFLTNGASQGNRTAALAVRSLGERVLIQRSSHSSFSDGMLIAGLYPTYASPSVDRRHGISHGLTPDALEDALRAEAEAGRAVASVYVVSPSYFGATADVAGLARVTHAYNAVLIVDNAWASHFGFHPALPESPARLGADIIVSSTHKLACSLTQSAMIHLGEGPFADELEPLIDRAFTMTSSTSASNIFKLSLDLTRQALITGREKIERALDTAERLREALREDPDFSIISDDYGSFDDIVTQDPLHIPIDVTALGQSGHWVREKLINEHAIYMEMSTAGSIVAVIGALAAPDVSRIMRAFRAVAQAAKALAVASGPADVLGEFPELPERGDLRMVPRDAFYGSSELVPAAQAAGRLSADTIAAYPPGIPNIVPGEVITSENITFLQAVGASPSGYVRGAVDPLVTTFRVVKDV